MQWMGMFGARVGRFRANKVMIEVRSSRTVAVPGTLSNPTPLL
jgi:hypothetical protein